MLDGVTLGDRVFVGVTLADGVFVGVALDDGVFVGVTDEDAVTEAVAVDVGALADVVDGAGDPEADGVTEAVSDGDMPVLIDADGEFDADCAPATRSAAAKSTAIAARRPISHTPHDQARLVPTARNAYRRAWTKHLRIGRTVGVDSRSTGGRAVRHSVRVTQLSEAVGSGESRTPATSHPTLTTGTGSTRCCVTGDATLVDLDNGKRSPRKVSATLRFNQYAYPHHNTRSPHENHSLLHRGIHIAATATPLTALPASAGTGRAG